MSLVVEESLKIFIIMTVILGGGAAYMAGRNLATHWRPLWMAIAYMIPLGLGLRFFHYALFESDLLSLHYLTTDTLLLMAATWLGYRLTRVKQMVSQYPWLYERAGYFSWKSR